MGWYAHIETDTYEVLRLLLPDGRTGGKSLLAFFQGLEGYCSTLGDSDLQRFAKLEAFSKESLCSLAKPCLQAYFSGDLYFQEDIYRFLHDYYEKTEISKEELQRNIQIAETRWVDIEALITGVNKLIKLLKEANLEEDDAWYHPTDTLADFEALYQTLLLLRDRNAKSVRINIQ